MKVLCTAQMGTATIMGQTMRVVAIAKVLQQRGHEVRFLAAGKLISTIKNIGLDVIEVSGMPEFEYPASDEARDELQVKLKDIIKEITAIEAKVARHEKPDFILSGTLTGAQVARQLDIPCMMVFLQPHGQRTVSMFADKITDGILETIGSAAAIVLEGMPEINGGVNFDYFDSKKIYFSGPLLAPSPRQLPPREELKQRHIGDKYRSMVYITIGGGSALIGENFLKIVLEAIRMMPEITGVVATGMAFPAEVLAKYEPPQNVIVRDFVPGTEMIKASDITVFHGGSSTLMTCIACGTPAVVVPSMGEQEDNGDVLAQTGAGIVVDKQRLTPEILVDAIRKILHDPAYRQQAEKLRSIGEKYGGAEAMASLAEKLLIGRSCYHEGVDPGSR